MFKYLILFSFILSSCDGSKISYYTNVNVVGKKINFIQSEEFYLDNVNDSISLILKYGTKITISSDSIETIRVYSKNPKLRSYPNKSNSDLVYITTIN